MKQIVINHRAINDIKKAGKWYEKQQENLGVKFPIIFLNVLRTYIIIRQDTPVNAGIQEKWPPENFLILLFLV